MSERLERIAGPFLVGSFLPVLVVVCFGLMNEGFSSLAFLFYPGLETWIQIGLLGLLLVLLALSLPALRGRAVHAARSSPAPTLVASLAGLALASTVLYLIGIGETPWRKFYTYIVAPRAVSAWLVFAVAALLLSRKTRSPKHAA